MGAEPEHKCYVDLGDTASRSRGGITMTPRRVSPAQVQMSDADFEVILARAAEEGAKRALADVGLDGRDAAVDIRDLRALLDSIRLARRTALQTFASMLTTALILALIAGVAVKFKLFGTPPQ